jgi:hypothetical protein
MGTGTVVEVDADGNALLERVLAPAELHPDKWQPEPDAGARLTTGPRADSPTAD